MILDVCAAELCPLSEGLCYIYIYIITNCGSHLTLGLFENSH